MHAVEFLKEYKRMCGQIACESCLLHSNSGCDLLIGVPESLDLRGCVEAVEQWAKDHPAKTRQSEFLKMFPDARLGDGEVIHICPNAIDTTTKCLINDDINCYDCRRIYWLQEVE